MLIIDEIGVNTIINLFSPPECSHRRSQLTNRQHHDGKYGNEKTRDQNAQQNEKEKGHQ